jgi:hypothetical protein
VRAIAIATGAMILAAVTHVNIEAGTAYGTPASFLMLAVAVGVGVSAFVVGHAWDSNRRWLAAGLVLAVAVGEFFNLTATAERLVAGREASQAFLRAGEKRLADARQRVLEAKLAVEATKTSARLKAAQEAKIAADKAIADSAAQMGCRRECRVLLEGAAAVANAEVTAAREALKAGAASANAELKAAETALAGIAPPPSATPLADRLGLPPWFLDLFHSALGSIAANGLAFLLIAFGAHRTRPVVEIVQSAPEPEPAPQETRRPARKATRRLPSPAKDHATRFGMARLCPGDGATDLRQIRLAYRTWATGEEGGPLPDAEIAPALAEMFAKAGIEVDRGDDGKPVVIGVAIKRVAAEA